VVNKAAARICLENPSASNELLRGKSVLEIKQVGFRKATGVRELMRYPPFRDRHPIFIGDDVTDESVFEIIGDFGGLAFSVGRTVSGVDGYFENPEAVRGWLARISDDGATAAL
ncbi:MAG: trehalose-phosphatase, partial [Methylocella sp.]